MKKIEIKLPKHRLTFRWKITKRRKSSLDDPLLPTVKEIRRARRGKLSFLFRHVFEHSRIKQVLGSTLLFTFFAGVFIPNSVVDNALGSEPGVIAVTQVNLSTLSGVRIPLDQVKLNQGFSWYHPGYDFDGEIGDPVYPVMGGVVEAIQLYKQKINPSISAYAYGNAIIINHGNGLTTLYAHLSKVSVKEGDTVTTSTVIGQVGSTGRSTGSHLHLEIRDHNRALNPSLVLPKIVKANPVK